jgi:hypothetical protein
VLAGDQARDQVQESFDVLIVPLMAQTAGPGLPPVAWIRIYGAGPRQMASFSVHHMPRFLLGVALAAFGGHRQRLV